MAQAVVIPNGTATLSFHVEAIICASPTDFLEVTVDSTQVYLLDGTSPLCSQLGYTEQTVDLSAYADGNSHTIAFHSISGTGGSNFFVDDVVLDSTPGCVANDIPWLSINPTSGTTAAVVLMM
ncbi:MAG: hypothetical protein IPL28_21150 [Chloroflexi bacterium]|nr:hypothetical protein [Chloroflexota bacterium]